MNARIMIVDDDRSIRETLEHHLEREGYDVSGVESAESALSALDRVDPDLVITDVRMSGMDGLSLLRRIREAGETDVVVITAYDSMESAVAAMRAGAYDYLVKPLDLDQIDLLIERCLRHRRLRRRVRHLSGEAQGDQSVERLVGRDPAMIEIYKLIGLLAENRTTVLIHGETGTGKERIARAIHFSSPFSDEPFLALNCTAIPEPLLESELFGHARGAFTGAVQARRGYFELAGEGTVFLDEIGRTEPAFQAKLLRVLEDREFYPVGAERPRRTGARVIAATQRPLDALVREGVFREDLLFRLQVVEIRVPPLRERRGDIPLLTDHFLRRIATELHREIEGITDAAVRALAAYDWPGNVRELEHALTRAVVVARGPVIDTEHLSLEGVLLGSGSDEVPEDASLSAVEAAHVQKVLRREGGVKRRAAEALDISRTRLDRLIEKYELEVPS